MPLSERVRRAREVLEVAGQSVSAKGGQARADVYAQRDKAMYMEYLSMIDQGKQHTIVINSLSKKYKLTPGTIRRILNKQK